MDTPEEPLNLPILEAQEDGAYFVLLPGLDRFQMKKWDWEKEDGVLVVEVYYGGFDEEGNIRGTRYPIELTEEKEVLLSASERLIPMNPLDVEFERYFDEDEAEEYESFFRELDERFRDD
jgi:hypothetical protein